MTSVFRDLSFPSVLRGVMWLREYLGPISVLASFLLLLSGWLLVRLARCKSWYVGGLGASQFFKLEPQTIARKFKSWKPKPLTPNLFMPSYYRHSFILQQQQQLLLLLLKLLVLVLLRPLLVLLPWLSRPGGWP